MMDTFKQTMLSISFLMGLMLLVLYSYWPGTSGLFIFDDMPNLSPMGKYNTLSQWDNFKLFLLEGSSGPTGRPISLASFYLNDNAWPSNPASFTVTNILIHLINGLLVFLFVNKLASLLQLAPKQSFVFPFLATALWVLHPLQTTTVLYIVQRMTELSALFMLTGLIAYLYGREKLFKQPIKGLLLLYAGVGLSLIFSIFSKENGILLVAYILVIEFFLLQLLTNKAPKYLYHWMIPAVIFPFIIILVYLGLRAWQGGGFDIRDFTLKERLLTEPRIIFNYIQHILLPSIGDSSLFHDDYLVSRSLFSPWTTLPAIIGIFALAIFSFIARKKYPIFAFAIAWFFAGHLLESTVISLELYFEHRNYLPMLGLLMAASWYASQFIASHKIPTLTLSGLTIGLFSFLVTQNAILWSKPVELSVNWYQAHPNSMRAQEAYLNFMKPLGISQKDFSQTQLAIRKKSAYTAFWELDKSCQAQTIKTKQLDITLNTLKTYPIHVSASTALAGFISSWKKGDCPQINKERMEKFLLALSDLNTVKKTNIVHHYIHYWLSEFYLQQHDLSKTMFHLDKAYTLSPDLALLKLRAAYLLSAGLYKEALAVLNDTSLLEKKGYRAKLALNIKQKDLKALKKAITIKTKGI